MSQFKIEKQAELEPNYCDYIKERIDIAKKNGAVYELSDEDYRIQALYDQEDLITKDKIKTINRVRSTEDGKEYLVVNKTVDFYTPEGDKLGAYKDRYYCQEGIVELPLRSINPETGLAQVKETKLVYTIPFSATKVDEYLGKSQESVPILTFYEGSTTSTRRPNNVPTVGNTEYFKQGTWNELIVGREEKAINSVVNRLPEIRKKIKTNEPEAVARPEISSKDTPLKEVNKAETVTEPIVKPKQDTKLSANSSPKPEASNKKT